MVPSGHGRWAARCTSLPPRPVRLSYFSYRLAQEVLESSTYRQEWGEVQDILTRLRPSPGGRQKHPVSQQVMNAWLDDQFRARDWEYHPRIIEGTRLEGDYRKHRIQVEVQFGNMARWTYDVLKFQISYSKDLIDIGILTVSMQEFAGSIGDNIAYFERVCRELPHAKLSITLPIMVIGIEPE